jgi:hypothetical protein
MLLPFSRMAQMITVARAFHLLSAGPFGVIANRCCLATTPTTLSCGVDRIVRADSEVVCSCRWASKTCGVGPREGDELLQVFSRQSMALT